MVRPSIPLRGRPTVGLLAVVLVLAACGGSQQAGGSSASVSASGGTPAAGPTSSGVNAGRWTALPASPLPALVRVTGLWDGSELLVAGEVANTDPPATAAAAYNPSTQHWRRLPAPSPGGPGRYEGELETVWTGKEMIMLGASYHTAYSPATNRWRPLPDTSAAHLGGFAMVWTGAQVLTWGGGCCDSFEATGAAYTPATNTWTALPTSPLAGRLTTGAWTGTELVIPGGTGGDRRVRDSEGREVDLGPSTVADGAAYNPTTRAWRAIAPLPAPRTGETLTWDGHELVAVGGAGENTTTPPDTALAYDPGANRWRTLPRFSAGRINHGAVWTGRQLLVWGGGRLVAGELVPAPHGDAYSPATNTWTALPMSPLRGRGSPVVAWTGHALLVWGGDGRTDGAVYAP